MICIISTSVTYLAEYLSKDEFFPLSLKIQWYYTVRCIYINIPQKTEQIAVHFDYICSAHFAQTIVQHACYQ